jgi:hypothetical protein
MINVIGDSHVWSFSEIDGYRFHAFLSKSCTAHQLVNKKEQLMQLLNMYPEELWLFYFGEIDSRIHIYLKSNINKIPYIDLCKDTANRYVGVIKELINNNFNVKILTQPPQGFEVNINNYPYYAGREERQRISEMLALEIKTQAKEEGVEVIDLFVGISLPDRDFYQDSVHVKQETIIGLLQKLRDERKDIC